jgi:aminoglycoside phosphotransferase (APT) family kinase protein
MLAMQPRIARYLARRDWSAVPAMAGRTFTVTPLAGGEYNYNFLLTAGEDKRVFRVNLGTQIARDDQIRYEFKALQLLASSGVTPRPYFVDDTLSDLDHGISIMEYLPGRALVYETDLEQAAGLLARIHQVPVAADRNHLIREEAPLDLIYRECAGLLQTYFESDLADPDILSFLREVIDWARTARRGERYYQQDPWPCIVNTEVNAGNFIVDPARGRIHLIDWEMPRWGDPSQDLCHFCSPLTTLWKTDYRMKTADKKRFLEAYKRGLADRHLCDTLEERMRLRDPFVYLRGISWSAMGWVAYQTKFEGRKNPDTWQTLQRYMRLDFIRPLFTPFMQS